MIKKPVFWVIMAAVIALFAAAALGRQYYGARYVGTDYYAMVPPDYDMTPVAILNRDGRDTGETGIRYSLTAYGMQGEAKSVSFTVYSPESGFSRGEVQPQPGTYLWISASRQLVVKWGATDESDIPEKAMKMIMER